MDNNSNKFIIDNGPEPTPESQNNNVQTGNPTLDSFQKENTFFDNNVVPSETPNNSSHEPQIEQPQIASEPTIQPTEPQIMPIVETQGPSVISNVGVSESTPPPEEIPNSEKITSKGKKVKEKQNQEHDESLLEAYIGNNYKHFKAFFNIPALILGPFYLFYRRFILLGLIITFLDVLFINFLSPIFIIFVNIIIGLTFNFIYKFKGNLAIKRIKKRYPKATPNALRDMATREGGAGIGYVFLGILLELIIVAITILILLKTGVIKEIPNNIKDLAKRHTFPTITDTKTNIENYYMINIPDAFENKSTNYEYRYTVEGEKEYSSCSLSLSSKQDFIGPEKLLKVMNFFETWSASDTIEKKEANNIVWYTYSAKNLNERTDYYITEKDNKTFLVEYNVQKDSNSICEEFGKILIDSVLNKEA